VVIPFAVVHASGAPALALRVTWQGHTIAYTGDTEWTQALVELAGGAELLIAEGYTSQRKIRFTWTWRACRSTPAGWQPAG
jgi:ribonuclease BN (tRNA processing enzyme)